MDRILKRLGSPHAVAEQNVGGVLLSALEMALHVHFDAVGRRLRMSVRAADRERVLGYVMDVLDVVESEMDIWPAEGADLVERVEAVLDASLGVEISEGDQSDDSGTFPSRISDALVSREDPRRVVGPPSVATSATSALRSPIELLSGTLSLPVLEPPSIDSSSDAFRPDSPSSDTASLVSYASHATASTHISDLRRLLEDLSGSQKAHSSVGVLKTAPQSHSARSSHPRHTHSSHSSASSMETVKERRSSPPRFNKNNTTSSPPRRFAPRRVHLSSSPHTPSTTSDYLSLHEEPEIDSSFRARKHISSFLQNDLPNVPNLQNPKGWSWETFQTSSSPAPSSGVEDDSFLYSAPGIDTATLDDDSEEEEQEYFLLNRKKILLSKLLELEQRS